jgi:lipopolysaccharide biosynthesis glycosyltransferase
MSNWQSIFNLIERDNSDVAIRATIDGSIVEHNLKLYGNNTAYQRGGKSYFNSGVFIASPKVWKNKGFNVSWPKVAANHRELGFIHHDQDVLNYLLHDSKEIINSSFNSIVMQGSYIDQKILHFTGRPKPWQFTSESQNYFVALEVLKAKNGKGAFGGLNWHLEYQNYWRYESAMMINVESDVVLREGLEKLRQGSKIRLMSFKDKFKFIILNLSGRKWI